VSRVFRKRTRRQELATLQDQLYRVEDRRSFAKDSDPLEEASFSSSDNRSEGRGPPLRENEDSEEEAGFEDLRELRSDGETKANERGGLALWSVFKHVMGAVQTLIRMRAKERRRSPSDTGACFYDVEPSMLDLEPEPSALVPETSSEILLQENLRDEPASHSEAKDTGSEKGRSFMGEPLELEALGSDPEVQLAAAINTAEASAAVARPKEAPRRRGNSSNPPSFRAAPSQVGVAPIHLDRGSQDPKPETTVSPSERPSPKPRLPQLQQDAPLGAPSLESPPKVRAVVVFGIISWCLFCSEETRAWLF